MGISELMGRDERLVALRSRQQTPKSGHLDNFFRSDYSLLDSWRRVEFSVVIPAGESLGDCALIDTYKPVSAIGSC
jgi:hypothetical protein